MTLKDDLKTGFNTLIQKAGTQIRLRYFNETVGSVWDDEVNLVQSGTDLWTSGIVLPLNGTADSFIVEAGKLKTDDKKLYTHGSLTFTGLDLQFKVQIGSPTGDEYNLFSPGTVDAEVENTKIYKKAYLRRIDIGSLIGE